MRHILCAAILLITSLSTTTVRAEDDWQVTTSQSKKNAEKNRELYKGIKTQEVWEREFKKAFDRNDIPAILHLIKITKPRGLSFDINAKNADGRTLLHQAVVRDKPALVRALLNLSADVNAKDSTGNRALHLAVRSLSTKSISLLLDHEDVERDAENDAGERAVGLALESGNPLLFQILRKHKFNFDFEMRGLKPEELVFKRDNIAAFEFIFGKIDPEALPTTRLNSPVLHSAARFNAVKITNYLLKKGVDPWVEDQQKRVAFQIALTSVDNTEIIKTYLKKDRHFVSLPDRKTGNTPLHTAFAASDFALADVLLKFNPPLDVLNSEGLTPAAMITRVKDETKTTDPELLKTFEKYENLAKATVALDQRLEISLNKNDVKEFEKIAWAIPKTQVDAVFNRIFDGGNAKMLELLFKAQANALSSNATRILQNPKLFTMKYWPLSEIVLRELGFNSGHCTITPCAVINLASNGESAVIEKLMKMKPRPNLNIGHPMPLDFIASKLQDSSNKANDRDRLKEIDQALRKHGVLNKEEKQELFKELGELLKAGKGVNILENYPMQTLQELETEHRRFPFLVLDLALLYDDIALAKAMASAAAPKNKNLAFYALASPRMLKILAKYGVNPPASTTAAFPCAQVFNSFEIKQHSERLKEWIKETQLAQCSDIEQLAIAAMTYDTNESTEILKAVTEVPGVRKHIDRVSNGGTALSLAVHLCNPAALGVLLENGADPNFTTSSGQTPLYRAVTNWACDNTAEMAEKLIAAGANVNATITSNEGSEISIVHAAVRGQGTPGGVDSLIKHGADLSLIDPTTKLSVVEEIASSDDAYLADVLIENGLKPYIERDCSDKGSDGKPTSIPVGTPSRSGQSIRPVFKGQTNRVLLAYRLTQKEAAKQESCDTVKQRAQTEFTKEVLLLDSHINQWKALAIRWNPVSNGFGDDFKKNVAKKSGLVLDEGALYQKAGNRSFCCGFNNLARCRSQLICTDKNDEKEASQPFCNHFGDISAQTLSDLKTVIKSTNHEKADDTKPETALKVRARNKLKKLNVDSYDNLVIEITTSNNLYENDDATPLFSFIVPIGRFEIEESVWGKLGRDYYSDGDDKRNAAERQIRAQVINTQVRELYKIMHLNSLADYVEWKYPQCAGVVSTDAKVTGDAGTKTTLTGDDENGDMPATPARAKHVR